MAKSIAESMSEQLATENKRLRAKLEERDHTIAQLRRENQELCETVAALQAQALREQEAALNSTVRIPCRRRERAHPAPLTRLHVSTGSFAECLRSGWVLASRRTLQLVGLCFVLEKKVCMRR